MSKSHFKTELKNLSEVFHGVETAIFTQKDYLFKDCPKEFKVGRYHSWAYQKHCLIAWSP